MDYFSSETIFVIGIIIGVALTIAFEIAVMEVFRG